MENILLKDLSPHKPVLLKEVVKYLNPQDDERYLDCTFGAGGYSRALLNSCKCSVTAIDQDENVKNFADDLKRKYGNRFNFIQTNFGKNLEEINSVKFDGIVMDLGISSMQIDTPERGFSFMHDGPLDMRMGNYGKSAADFINTAEEKEIAEVIYKYGEEDLARKIARNIITKRKNIPVTRTLQLANIVREVIGNRKGKIDPATKTFQAIRIYVNKELKSLEDFLQRSNDILALNGRLIIVSFHSLEDGLVKNFFKEKAVKIMAKSKYSIKKEEIVPGKWLRILTKKPITPSDEEVLNNPRARSAKLRVAVKIG